MQEVEHEVEHPLTTVKIGMCGKYTDLSDSYKSLNEALRHAGIHNHVRVNIEYVDSESLTPETAGTLQKYDAILVPGGFGARGVEGKISTARFARENKVPYLGICLGMQIMARVGFEQEETVGLGWFDADVVLMQPGDSHCKVPNVGWQDVSYRPGSPLFRQFPPRPDFYFVHSYAAKKPVGISQAWSTHNEKFLAAVEDGAIAATQFHPEKSGDAGLALIANWVKSL